MTAAQGLHYPKSDADCDNCTMLVKGIGTRRGVYAI
jgi:hypothetical protein